MNPIKRMQNCEICYPAALLGYRADVQTNYSYVPWTS